MFQSVKKCYCIKFIGLKFCRFQKKHYLCDILVFFVRKRLRIKMGQMVTERGNHLFLYTFQSKIFALAVQVTRFARDFWLHLGLHTTDCVRDFSHVRHNQNKFCFCSHLIEKFLIPNS